MNSLKTEGGFILGFTSVLFSRSTSVLMPELTERVTELLESEPSLLVLPAESENLEEATEITPSVVLSAVCVKVAE